MLIETDDIILGLAWNLDEAEEILERDRMEDRDPDEIFNLPIVVLATTAPDEEAARESWRKKYPNLVINTVMPLNTLIDEGAVS